MQHLKMGHMKKPSHFKFLKSRKEKKKKLEEKTRSRDVITSSSSCPVEIAKEVIVQPKPVYDIRHIIDKEPENFVEFNQYSTLLGILRKTEQELLGYCLFYLKDFCEYPEKNIIATKDYIYAEGDIPVLLIAHLDTVHHSPPTTIYQHIKEKYLIAREGIGGDDRCGVYAIFWILANKFRPCVLFTTQEETGGQGARIAEKELKVSPDIKFMVEIDRRGRNDCVFYRNDNKDFIKYIEGFGFKEATGSFSDISVLGPAWDIASVNLSSGYYNAHTREEKIYTDQLFDTIDKIIKMFGNLPEKPYKHVEKKYTWTRGAATTWEDYYDVYGYGSEYLYGRSYYPQPASSHARPSPATVPTTKAGSEKKGHASPEVVATTLDCIELLKSNGVAEEFFFRTAGRARAMYNNPEYIPTAEFANVINTTKTRQGIYTIRFVQWRKEFKNAEIRNKITQCAIYIDSQYTKYQYFADDLEALHEEREKQKKARAITTVDDERVYFGIPEAELRTSIACVETLKQRGFLSSVTTEKGTFYRFHVGRPSRDNVIYGNASVFLSNVSKDPAFVRWLAQNQSTWDAVRNCVKWIDSMCKKYENFWTVVDQFTSGTVKPDTVKQPTLHQIEKAYKALDLVAKLPITSKIWLFNPEKEDEPIKEPFFLLSGTEKTYWLSDLLRSNSSVYNLIEKKERASVRPGIDFLNTMYQKYPVVFAKNLAEFAKEMEGKFAGSDIEEMIAEDECIREEEEWESLIDGIQYLSESFPEFEFQWDTDDITFIDEKNVTRPLRELKYYINGVADDATRKSLMKSLKFVTEYW